MQLNIVFKEHNLIIFTWEMKLSRSKFQLDENPFQSLPDLSSP